MPAAGDVAKVWFPFANPSKGKHRPVLVIGKCPGKYNDWLVCAISSKQHQATTGVDELVNATDADYAKTGLVKPSVIRVGRVAVVEASLLVGAIGKISAQRIKRVKASLKGWVAKL